LDFSTADVTAIDSLFNGKIKGDSLVFFAFDRANAAADFERAEGWNLIGGQNTSSFLIGKVNGDSTVNLAGRLLYYWNNGLANWDSFYPRIENKVLSPYVTVYLQTTSNEDAAQGFFFHNNGRSLDRANPAGFRSLQANAEDLIAVRLSDNNQSTNRVLLEFREGFSKAYSGKEDGVALLSDVNGTPQIWALPEVNGIPVEVSLDRLPVGVNEVKLGVRVLSGEYTFDLKEYQNNGIRNAVLLDKLTGTETDLLASTYTFRTNSNLDSGDRFVLFVNKVITAIDPLQKSSEIYAYTSNNILTVKNVQAGNKIQVVDLTGRTIVSGVATGSDFSVTLGQKGLYVVNVLGDKANNKDGKVIKVLNK
jgi:hypothetical protein